MGEIEELELVEKLTLALIYLTKFKDKDIFNEDFFSAWKGYDFGVLNALEEKGFIHQGKHPSRTKSVVLSEDGLDIGKKIIESIKNK